MGKQQWETVAIEGWSRHILLLEKCDEAYLLHPQSSAALLEYASNQSEEYLHGLESGDPRYWPEDTKTVKLWIFTLQARLFRLQGEADNTTASQACFIRAQELAPIFYSDRNSYGTEAQLLATLQKLDDITSSTQ